MIVLVPNLRGQASDNMDDIRVHFGHREMDNFSYRQREVDTMVDLYVEPVLNEVHPTGIALGVGRYWQQEEVEVAGTMCAAIRLHGSLDSVANRQRFASECKMMSSLRHPHIVTLLGTSYLHGSLALVTEKLPYNLTNILSGCPDIPLCLKYSILGDVAQGLIYLHTHSIIHHDISTMSVMLNSALKAKIGDFSAAKYMGDPEPVYDFHTQYIPRHTRIHATRGRGRNIMIPHLISSHLVFLLLAL